MRWPTFAVGILVIIVGFFHVFRPKQISGVLKDSYRHSPIFKRESDLESRAKFIMILGLVWISLGLYTLILSLRW